MNANFANLNIDWIGMARSVASGLEEELLPLLKAEFAQAQADFKTWILTISRDIVNAARMGDKKWGDEIAAQARVLAEILKVRAGETTWDGVMRALRIAFKVVSAVLL